MKRYILILLFIFGSVESNEPKKSVESRPYFALFDAIRAGDLKGIRSLIKDGANTRRAFSDLVIAMDPIYEQHLNSEIANKIADIFVENNIDINQLDSLTLRSNTSLNQAVASNMLDAVKILLKHGANPNIKNAEGPPIMKIRAFKNEKQSFEIFKLLIDAGANPNIQNYWGDTILLQATSALKGFADDGNLRRKMIRRLLFEGADMTLSNYDNESFFSFIDKPYVSSLAKEFVLFALGSDLTKNKGTQNALLIAAYFNDAKSVEQLLKKGAWFRSKKYALYFNNIIADKPALQEVIRNYKNDVAQQVSNRPELIPDIANIIAEY